MMSPKHLPPQIDTLKLTKRLDFASQCPNQGPVSQLETTAFQSKGPGDYLQYFNQSNGFHAPHGSNHQPSRKKSKLYRILSTDVEMAYSRIGLVCHFTSRPNRIFLAKGHGVTTFDGLHIRGDPTHHMALLFQTPGQVESTSSVTAAYAKERIVCHSLTRRITLN